MSLMDEARADAKEILLSGGFETDITFTSPTAQVVATKGVAIRRTDTLEFDDGSKKMSPFASVTVPMDVFGFTENYVSLRDWEVKFTDSEKERTYYGGDTLPNRTLGIINVTLKDKKD